MKRIYRSRTDKKLGGICGGFGELFEIDPTLIRLAMVFGCIATGVFPLFITYVVGWWIIPEGPIPPPQDTPAATGQSR